MSEFRELSDKEALESRQWAWKNYKAGEPINPMWHPVVREECKQITRWAGRFSYSGGEGG